MGEEARRGAEFDADGNLISWRLSYLRITELPECIGNCTALQTLNCWCCSSLESLPPSLWQLDIKDLDLGYCKSLDMDSTLERIALNFKNIEKLNIAGTNVTVLKELTMYQCPAFNKIPGVLKEKIQAQGCKIS